MTDLAKAMQDTSLPYVTDESRWSALMARDRNAEGKFYYSVRTTGVYCRPTCTARRPRRENVVFYNSSESAEAAGFRPCKRCQPDVASSSVSRHVKAIEEACRALERAEESPNLERIAETAGMSRFHFQRIFKFVTGVTPRAYFNECRARKVKAELSVSQTITQAIYNSGFNSSGRFYEHSRQMLGMTPKTFRFRGDRESIRFAVGECSLGSILVAATEKGLCSISLGETPEELMRVLQERFPAAKLAGGDADFERWMATVVGFVENPAQGIDLPLDIRGTAFQQRVWQALREIPLGSTASYEEIACKIGAPKSVRAVAGACASNQLAVAIPCHRVVKKNGGLSGYRWGVERKQTLLDREERDASVR